MGCYDFTLRFSLTDPSVPIDARVERLAAEHCDDALPGIGLSGRLALAFSREADSARHAVLSALADARQAMPDAVLVEAAPDLVGLSEVASTMGFSRQNMRKLMFGCVSSGPAPVHDSNPSIWHLAPVLVWLRDERSYAVDPELLALASVTMQLNVAVASAREDPSMQREIRAVLA